MRKVYVYAANLISLGIWQLKMSQYAQEFREHYQVGIFIVRWHPCLWERATELTGPNNYF